MCLSTERSWYTAPYFLCPMLDRGLQLMDTEIIIKTGFFMRHLQVSASKNKNFLYCPAALWKSIHFFAKEIKFSFTQSLL